MMLCEELKYERLGDAFNDYPDSTLVIRKQYVDAAIAELKAIVTTDNSAVIARLEDSLRKTQRALWLTRAEWARSSALSYHLIESHPDKDVAATYKRKANKWEMVKAKCLAKAKEYE